MRLCTNEFQHKILDFYYLHKYRGWLGQIWCVNYFIYKFKLIYPNLKLLLLFNIFYYLLLIMLWFLNCKCSFLLITFFKLYFCLQIYICIVCSFLFMNKMNIYIHKPVLCFNTQKYCLCKHTSLFIESFFVKKLRKLLLSVLQFTEVWPNEQGCELCVCSRVSFFSPVIYFLLGSWSKIKAKCSRVFGFRLFAYKRVFRHVGVFSERRYCEVTG